MSLLDSHLNRLAAVVIGAAIIVVVGTEAARLTMSMPGASPPYFWPVIGLGTGLALSIDRRYWPILVLLLILIDLPFLDSDAYNTESLVNIVIGHGSHYALVICVCWILKLRHPGGIDFASLNNGLRDFLVAAAAIASMTGVIDLLLRLVSGTVVTWQDWYAWFALDLMSILVVAPFIATWISSRPRQAVIRGRSKLFELITLGAATCVVFYFGLHGPPGQDRTVFDFVWVLVLWAIFRFDIRVMTTIILFTTAFIAAKTDLSPDGLGHLLNIWQEQSLITSSYISVATSIALITNALFVYSWQKRAEIDQARHYVDLLIRTTGSFLWVFNVAQRRYEYFSDTDTGQWTDTIGMRDSPGKIFDYLHPGDQQDAGRTWNRILNGEQKQPFNFTYRLVNEAGDVRWDRNIGIALVGEDGNVERYVGMILDITDETQLRAEKHRLHDVIRESEKLHAVGTLSAGMAHDWNNLLLVLSMEATRVEELAKARPELNDTVAALQQIVAEGRSITNELMSLARREREPTTVCNIYEEVRKGTDLLRRAVPSNISIKTDFDPDGIARVRCKVKHLIQIILNLGLNARDAIGRKAGKITIRLEGPHAGIIGEQQRSVATLQVTDDGDGIPEDVIDRILEPLYTTKAERGGTGLGLSVVRDFVAEMDGEIAFESTQAAGTTITVILPLAPDSLTDGKLLDR